MRLKYPPMPREESTLSFSTIRSVKLISEIPINAITQQKVASEIMIAEKKLIESKQIYNITTNYQLRHNMYAKIIDFQIKSNQDKIVKLKRNVKYVQNCKKKNRKCL